LAAVPGETSGNEKHAGRGSPSGAAPDAQFGLDVRLPDMLVGTIAP